MPYDWRGRCVGVVLVLWTVGAHPDCCDLITGDPEYVGSPQGGCVRELWIEGGNWGNVLAALS